MKESDNLIDTWVGRVVKYLDGLPAEVSRISSRKLKVEVHADKVAPRTWAKVTEQCTLPKKDNMGKGVVWEMEGQSLVRQVPIDWGVEDEVEGVAV